MIFLQRFRKAWVVSQKIHPPPIKHQNPRHLHLRFHVNRRPPLDVLDFWPTSGEEMLAVCTIFVSLVYLKVETMNKNSDATKILSYFYHPHFWEHFDEYSLLKQPWFLYLSRVKSPFVQMIPNDPYTINIPGRVFGMFITTPKCA